LDTHLAKKNTADIQYDADTHVLYVPSFNGKTVAAYRLMAGGTASMGAPANGLAAVPPRVLLMDGDRLAALKKK